jgi:hypothetical protein
MRGQHKKMGQVFKSKNGCSCCAVGELQPGVQTWLKWTHQHFEVVWLASWLPAKVRTLLRVVYCEKFLKNFPDPPVKCADWSSCSSMVEWLSQAIPKLQGRQWNWIDDEISTYQKEIESLKLPEDRCIEVNKYGAEALEELREGLETFHYDEAKKTLASR